MSNYSRALEVMTELFGKDCQFSLATSKDNIPSVRVVDAYYENEAFWIVTYAKSNKVKEIESNPNAALCNNLYSFKGKAFNENHPLKDSNKEIREKLIKVLKAGTFFTITKKTQICVM